MDARHVTDTVGGARAGRGSGEAGSAVPRRARLRASPDNAASATGRRSPPRDASPQSPLPILQLPTELQERILGFLAPVDLVACRQTCRHWRALVRAMEERDAGYYFQCGAADVCALPQAAHAFSLVDGYDNTRLEGTACTCGAHIEDRDCARFFGAGSEDEEEEEDSEEGDSEESGGDDRDAESEDVDVGDEEDEPAEGRAAHQTRRRTSAPFARRHVDHLPLARWQVLRAERDLALDLTAQARRLSRVFLNVAYDYGHGQGVSMSWVPCWFYLPDSVIRPTSAPALRALVEGLVGVDREDYVALLERLSRPGEARQFYGEAEASFAASQRSACESAVSESVRARHLAAYEAHHRMEMDFIGRVWELYPNDRDAREREHAAKRAGTSIAFAEFSAAYPNWTQIQEAYNVFAAEHAAALAAFRDAVDRGERLDTLVAEPAWREGWRLDVTATVAGVPPLHSFYDVAGAMAASPGTKPLFGDDADSFVRDCSASHWEVWQMKARMLAAQWRYCLQRGWDGLFRQHKLDDHAYRDLQRLGDADLTEALDGMVADVDACRAAFEARCHLASVVGVVYSTSFNWVGGLSPGGHLVGTLTFSFEGD